MREWSYKSSFAAVGLAVLIAFVVELLCGGREFEMPAWPGNAYLLLAFLSALLIMHLFRGRAGAARALSKIPMALAAITAFSAFCVLAGVIPQRSGAGGLLQLSGLSHLTSSLPFLVSGGVLLACLGLAILSRMRPPRLCNLGFVCNHLGLFLIVAGGAFGSGDFKRGMIVFRQSQSSAEARDERGARVELPFTLTLKDFAVEYFPAETALFEKGPGADPPMLVYSAVAAAGQVSRLGEWEVTVEEFLSSAEEDGRGGFIGFSAGGGVAAARVRALNTASKEAAAGWISARGAERAPRHLMLDSRSVILLKHGSPRQFRSVLRAEFEDGSVIDGITLEVNKPYQLAGWQLYQAGYNQSAGQGADISAVEAVRDPWLVVVYIGIFMLMAGTLELLRRRTLFQGGGK